MGVENKINQKLKKYENQRKNCSHPAQLSVHAQDITPQKKPSTFAEGFVARRGSDSYRNEPMFLEWKSNVLT